MSSVSKKMWCDDNEYIIYRAWAILSVVFNTLEQNLSVVNVRPYLHALILYNLISNMSDARLPYHHSQSRGSYLQWAEDHRISSWEKFSL